MSKYSVDDLLQEADEAVSNPNWTIATSKRAELYLPGALGAAALGAAAVGGAAALEAAALGGAGALGLGAGALLGPAFAVVAIGLGANAINKRKKQQQAKELALKQLIAKQNAVIRALQNESRKDKERIESLIKLNKILQKAIQQLKES